MNQDSPPVAAQETDAVDDKASPQIGQRLRQARESLSISIEHAATQLHLDARLLTALEEDDFEALPGTAYAYGYLRSYARLLKLPEEEILQQYLQITQTDTNTLVPEHMTFAEKNKVPSFSVAQALLVGIIVIVVIGAVAWVMMGNVLQKNGAIVNNTSVMDSAQQTVSPVEQVLPVAEEVNIEASSIEAKKQTPLPDSEQVNPVADTDKASPAKALLLTFQADSWTEVRDASGETLIYRMVSAGERLELESQAPYTILLGYAPGVSVTYQGAIFDTKPFQRDDIAYFRIGQQSSGIATEE